MSMPINIIIPHHGQGGSNLVLGRTIASMPICSYNWPVKAVSRKLSGWQDFCRVLLSCSASLTTFPPAALSQRLAEFSRGGG